MRPTGDRVGDGTRPWAELVILLARNGGLAPLALAVVLFAAGLAGGIPIWLSMLLGALVGCFGLMVLAMMGGRQAEHTLSRGEREGPMESAHLRASALMGQVLAAVIVGAFSLEMARANLAASPWTELGALAAITYLGGMIWFARRR